MLVDVYSLVSMAMVHAVIKPLIAYIQETNLTKIYDMCYGEWRSQIHSQSFVLQMSSLMDCSQLMLVRVLPLCKAQWIGKFLTHSPLM